MRDNLLFFNIPENERENTTNIIHKILEEKMELHDGTQSRSTGLMNGEEKGGESKATTYRCKI